MPETTVTITETVTYEIPVTHPEHASGTEIGAAAAVAEFLAADDPCALATGVYDRDVVIDGHDYDVDPDGADQLPDWAANDEDDAQRATPANPVSLDQPRPGSVMTSARRARPDQA